MTKQTNKQHTNLFRRTSTVCNIPHFSFQGGGHSCWLSKIVFSTITYWWQSRLWTQKYTILFTISQFQNLIMLSLWQIYCHCSHIVCLYTFSNFSLQGGSHSYWHQNTFLKNILWLEISAVNIQMPHNVHNL